MLDLTLDSTNRVTELYLLAVQNGLVDIYCSHTGMVIGSIAGDEMMRFIELQLTLNPFLDDEGFIDHLQLMMIPSSSRPSPLFQGMTQKQYAQMAKQFPEQMFRFLAGKLVFERWNHLAGHVNHGGKLAWLKEIQALPIESVAFKDTLASLIRIDAVFSLRRCFISHELKAKLESIRSNWPGFADFYNFVYELETANITRLGNHNTGLDGRIVGNSLAQIAAIQTVSMLTPEEYEQAMIMRKKAQALHDAARDLKAKEATKRVNEHYSEILGGNEVRVKRGADAIIGLAVAQADSHGAADTEFVKRALAQYDFSKSQLKQLKIATKGSEVVKTPKKASSKPKKAPKIVFNLDLIPSIALKS